VFADDWQDMPLTRRQEDDFIAIRRAITSGQPLDRFYRASKTPDRLLRDNQVMHLHLGGSGSDVLVYLVQYPRHVLFVCIASHKYLQSHPPGIQLQILGRRRFEAAQRRDKAAREAQLLAASANLFTKPSSG
jgi:hypothetical protein